MAGCRVYLSVHKLLASESLYWCLTSRRHILVAVCLESKRRWLRISASPITSTVPLSVIILVAASPLGARVPAQRPSMIFTPSKMLVAMLVTSLLVHVSRGVPLLYQEGHRYAGEHSLLMLLANSSGKT